jgi:hypothetical protein
MTAASTPELASRPVSHVGHIKVLAAASPTATMASHDRTA